MPGFISTREDTLAATFSARPGWGVVPTRFLCLKAHNSLIKPKARIGGNPKRATMENPACGEIAIFLQLLIKLRSLRVSEATALLSMLRRRTSGSRPSLDEFLATCNRQIACSGMQIYMGFDGETSALALRCDAAAELPSREEPLQKSLHKLHLLGDVEYACAAAIFERILETRTDLSLKDFVRLCATHRVPSAPKFLRYMLELRWLASEASNHNPEKRQLTLGPCFYLELLPHFKGKGLPACTVCKQPGIVKLERCGNCSAEYHARCLEELRGKVQQQKGAQLTCCSCSAAWQP